MKILNFNYFLQVSNLKQADTIYFYEKDLIIKKYNKTNNGFIRNVKNDSLNRDKNVSILHKLYNLTVYNGNKESYNTHFNFFLKNFYFIFLRFSDDFSKYPEYQNLFSMLENKKSYYNFDFLLNESLREYESLFDIKISKVGKKYKFTKKKYNFELAYIYKKKRLKNVLKLINSFSKNNNIFLLKNKLFLTYLNIILDKKQSFLWGRKLYIYEKALKKFSK